MPNKHLSFAEYTEKWDKDPDTMKQKTEKAAKYAEELLRCKPHLIKNNRKDLAAELEKYCSAVIETSRPRRHDHTLCLREIVVERGLAPGGQHDRNRLLQR